MKTNRGCHPRTRITWASFLGSEEPSLKLLHSVTLQRKNSSPISNCRHSKSAIFLSHNINLNINSLLRLRVGMHIIYISIYIYIYIYLSDERYIPEVEIKTILGLPPPYSNYLGVFLRFRRTFAEVITVSEALAHKF